MENENYYMQLGAIQGWQCPICKRVLAPFVQECPCKGQGMGSITTTTITTTGTNIKEKTFDDGFWKDFNSTKKSPYEDTNAYYIRAFDNFSGAYKCKN